MAVSDFWERFFSGRKYRKYAGNRRFCRFSLGFFFVFRFFFRTKTLLIAIPTINHFSIVIKTYFWSQNCLKIAGTANFRRKTAFLKFLELYFIFFHEILHTDAKWQYLKYDRARFSKNVFFLQKMPKICWKNRFLAFSRDFIIGFYWFFSHR